MAGRVEGGSGIRGAPEHELEVRIQLRCWPRWPTRPGRWCRKCACSTNSDLDSSLSIAVPKVAAQPATSRRGLRLIVKGRPNDIEAEAAEGTRQQRAGFCDHRLHLGKGEGCLMGGGALPQLDNEHRVRIIVPDSHVVSEAADLAQLVVAADQVSDELIPPPGDST